MVFEGYPRALSDSGGRSSVNRALIFAPRALILSLYIGILAQGCGFAGDPNGPRISDFHFQEQMPGDPYTAIFAIAFTSADGSMGTGKMNFYVSGKTDPLTLDMASLFQSAGLVPRATSGEVGAAIRFSNDVPSGSTVDLEVQLVDANTRRSNRASVSLKFEVKNGR